ncbi:Wzz/FepE/Etk N-terminal domain-containing protein [Lactovum odontotermitis]
MQGQEPNETVINIGDILRLLYRRLGLIFLFTFIGAVLGSVYTFVLTTPRYTTHTQLVVRLPDSDTSNVYANQIMGNIETVTNTINQTIVSPVILDQVQKNLGLKSDDFQSGVTAAATTDSQVITVTVEYDDPYMAQKIANETASVFGDKANKLLNISNVSVLAEAKVNKRSVSPKPMINIGVSTLAGLILGIGLALLLAAFNNKINSESDIEVLGFTVLGSTAFAETSDFTTSEPDRIVRERIKNHPEKRMRRTEIRRYNGKEE